jgi:hypothetical protein
MRKCASGPTWITASASRDERRRSPQIAAEHIICIHDRQFIGCKLCAKGPRGEKIGKFAAAQQNRTQLARKLYTRDKQLQKLASHNEIREDAAG